MLYLLDANILIDAHRDYYPIDRIPQFWDWILDKAIHGKIKIPSEIYDEIVDGKDDDLVKWLKRNKKNIKLDEEVNSFLIKEVLNTGYADDLSDVELEYIGRDPFLIAYARNESDRCVVTHETSAPGKLRHKRKVPDVCQTFGVRSCNVFKLIRDLDFKIK